MIRALVFGIGPPGDKIFLLDNFARNGNIINNISISNLQYKARFVMNSMNKALLYSIFLFFSCPLLAQEAEPSPAISFFASNNQNSVNLENRVYQTEAIISLLRKKPDRTKNEGKVYLSFTEIKNMDSTQQCFLQLNITTSKGPHDKFLEKTFIELNELKESKNAQALMAELLKSKKDYNGDSFVRLTWAPRKECAPMEEIIKPILPIKQGVAYISPKELSALSTACGATKKVSASSSYIPLIVGACCVPLVCVAFSQLFSKSKNNI
jgi:hypothetical protein